MLKKLQLLVGIISIFLMSFNLNAQTYNVSFESSNPAIPIDSVLATNLRTLETLSVKSGESLNLVSIVDVNEAVMYEGKMEVFPNPMQQSTQLSFPAKISGSAVLAVYEVSGREIIRLQRSLETGINSFELSGINQGLYFVCVQGANYRYSAKVISREGRNGNPNLMFVGNMGQEITNSYKSASAGLDLGFTPGDEIKYVAYSAVCDAAEVTEATAEDKTISFTFTGCLASVSTADVSAIGYAEAISGGTITMFDEVTIDACGIKWGDSENTSEWIVENITSDTISNDAFVSSIKGLANDALYYVQSYIEVSGKTIYGDIKSFTTLKSPISASITSVDSVGYSIATFTAAITLSDSSKIDSSGFVYSSEYNPTIANCIGIMLCDTVNGSINVTIEGLELDSTYYIRAFIIDSNLTAYSTTTEIKTLAPKAPKLESSAPDSVYQTTAKCYAKVLDDGGLNTSRGFLFSLDSVITIESNTKKVSVGDGVGDFSSKIENLTPDTVYLVRAYAYNTMDTVYGTIDTIRTLAYSIPMIELLDSVAVYQTTIEALANIMSDGGKKISRYGFVISKDGSIPTYDDYYKKEYSFGEHTGQFSEKFTWLTAETKYHIRAFAKNELGVGYSKLDSITTIPVAAPVVSIDSISGVTPLNAICYVYLQSTGGENVSQKGAVWSTAGTPSILLNEGKATSTSTRSKFEIEMVSLKASTKYYVRSFAVNSIDTSYSVLDSVTTLASTVGEIGFELSSFASDSAILNCNVINNGGAEITAKGIIWSKTVNPTIEANDGLVADTIDNAEFDCIMNGLTENTNYYVRAYLTNAVGTVYTDSILFNSGYAIGKSFEGGKVGYVYQPGDNGYKAGECHGIIVAISDYMNKAIWGEKYQVPAAQQGELGKGWENTKAIVESFGNFGQNAAYLCTQRSSGGYTDWFLPSEKEMKMIYKNRETLGGFKVTDYANNMYWTSTDVRKDKAYTYNFEYGMSMKTNKDVKFWFRPARYF
ncbi:MAG: T9SS type A sorting domain-containing protein [Salinivirgaceae bacterium]|nr:T9SS type A sorting domain-containing protein [Salinivirgaceae bacterium]